MEEAEARIAEQRSPDPLALIADVHGKTAEDSDRNRIGHVAPKATQRTSAPTHAPDDAAGPARERQTVPSRPKVLIAV